MDLIERQPILVALEKAIVNTNPDYYKMDTREGYGDWMHSNGFNCAITHAIVTIENALAVDTVEVVYCKDCKHCANTWRLLDIAECTERVGHCKWANRMVKENGYCVYAKRKEIQE